MRAAVRGWSALLGGLESAVVWTRVALGQAGETPLDLSWDAPAECRDAAAVRADVARLAGAGSRRAQRLKARVRLTKISASTWTLAMVTELEGISGERTLTASSCGAVTDAAVLTMALILNPEVEIQTATEGAPRRRCGRRFRASMRAIRVGAPGVTSDCMLACSTSLAPSSRLDSACRLAERPSRSRPISRCNQTAALSHTVPLVTDRTS